MRTAILVCAAVLCFALSVATVPVEETVPVNQSMALGKERSEDPMTPMADVFEEKAVPLMEAKSRMMHDTNESSSCRAGWSKHNSRFFLFVNREMSWTDAEIHCLASKANLVSIHTPAENAFIQELVRSQTGTNTRAWIGGTDAVKLWQWFWSDGSKFSYQNWYAGEPNNYQGNERCTEINFSGPQLWNDRPCDHRIPFICGTRPDGPC